MSNFYKDMKINDYALKESFDSIILAYIYYVLDKWVNYYLLTLRKMKDQSQRLKILKRKVKNQHVLFLILKKKKKAPRFSKKTKFWAKKL